MYCPKCGIENADDTKFCRQCGGNVSLVIQSMAGELPAGRAVGWDAAGFPYDAQGRRIEQGPATIGNGVRDVSRGSLSLIGIVIIQILTDWPLWWLLFVVPQSIYYLSEGIGKIVQVKHGEPYGHTVNQRPDSFTEASPGELKRTDGYGQIPAPSISEHTTQQLEPVGKD